MSQAKDVPGFQQVLSDHVLTLTIDNPDRRNAVSGAMLRQLVEAFSRIDVKTTRVVILRGAGDKAFCSGYDLTALPGQQSQAADFEGPLLLTTVCAAIAACPVPTIAALKGACFGAGGELAMACDLRFAATDVKFGMPPAKLGIVYQQQGLARFVQTIGFAATKEIFFTGASWEAEDVVRLGLANRLLSADGFFDTVALQAKAIAANAPLAVQGMKRIIDAAAASVFSSEQHRDFDALRLRAFTSADYREGVAAMAQKRSPVFRGE